MGVVIRTAQSDVHQLNIQTFYNFKKFKCFVQCDLCWVCFVDAKTVLVWHGSRGIDCNAGPKFVRFREGRVRAEG